LGSPLFSEELATESCLLKLLPVKRPVFRKLEKDILYVSTLRLAYASSNADNNANANNNDDNSADKDDHKDNKNHPNARPTPTVTDKAFLDIAANMKETLSYIDRKRSSLEAVFNQDDSTDMTISKQIQGEGRIEMLRAEIENIMMAANRRDEGGVYTFQKRALRALSEVGEFLVDRFPFDVPEDGKFSYLPRLLGRAKVTFTILRPKSKKKGNGSEEGRILGNVTVLADGYAAPITAGNFVDLAGRNFYTGLPVKVLKKRLGVSPSLTSMAEDSVVAYDIASTVDKLTNEYGVVQKKFGRFKKKIEESNENAGANAGSNENANAGSDDSGVGTILTPMPIMGAFNEGFYDPLTAKPRRVPLEIVQYDRLTFTAKLSYESGFSSSSSSSSSGSSSSAGSGSGSGSGSSDSITSSSIPSAPKTKNPPLLTYDIPGLVGMNHPDKNLNGGSSEFFCLRKSDMTSGRTSLLDGQYAPFGYVMEGLDIMDNLQGGDVISATYVNEWGQMNLKKIRGTSFADAMNKDEWDE